MSGEDIFAGQGCGNVCDEQQSIHGGGLEKSDFYSSFYESVVIDLTEDSFSSRDSDTLADDKNQERGTTVSESSVSRATEQRESDVVARGDGAAFRPTKWGRCAMAGCHAPLVLRLSAKSTGSGRPFLGCSKFRKADLSSCAFTRDVPASLEDQLPPKRLVRVKTKY